MSGLVRPVAGALLFALAFAALLAAEDRAATVNGWDVLCFLLATAGLYTLGPYLDRKDRR